MQTNVVLATLLFVKLLIKAPLTMKYKEFYAELGKLLYAVADCDKVITPEEKKKLQDIIKNELVPNEVHTDAFGTDAAYYAEMEFDILEDELMDASTAFESFTDFIKEHPTAIDARMKKTILRVVKELAAAYHGTNKRESKLIEQLVKELKSIK